MSPIALLMIVSVFSMLTSTLGAVLLGRGPSVLWSAVMFAGMVVSYLAIGALVLNLYQTTGKLYPILALVPVAMTVAAFRAYKQSFTRYADGDRHRV